MLLIDGKDLLLDLDGTSEVLLRGSRKVHGEALGERAALLWSLLELNVLVHRLKRGQMTFDVALGELFPVAIVGRKSGLAELFPLFQKPTEETKSPYIRSP